MTTILTATLTGILILLAGNLPWTGLGNVTGLAGWNLHSGTQWPWAIVPMAIYLVLYWQVIRGRWAKDSRALMRANLRANRLTFKAWGASLAAGLVGFGALLALLSLAARLVPLPIASPIVTPPEMPLLTVVMLLSMQAIVAGVTEEAAFRGYMQSMIERRYGIFVAILASGTLFGLLHFGNHPADVFMMLPYYIAVSAVYSGLTWAVDSILPALVLHSLGDVVILIRWWATGRPEWQLMANPATPVWESGLDQAFALTLISFLVLAGLTVIAYRKLRRLRSVTGELYYS